MKKNLEKKNTVNCFQQISICASNICLEINNYKTQTRTAPSSLKIERKTVTCEVVLVCVVGTRGRVEIYPHLFLTSTPDVGKWPNLRSGRFTPVNRSLKQLNWWLDSDQGMIWTQFPGTILAELPFFELYLYFIIYFVTYWLISFTL
jgi:hypothetical protein